MKQLILALMVFALLVGAANAQFLEDWNARAVSPYDSERFYSGAEHPDGGVIAVGGQYNTGNGRFETVLCRMDVDGNVLWRYTYSYNNQNTTLFDVVRSPYYSDRYVGVGYTEPGAREFFILYFDENGNIIYPWSYNTSSGGELHTISVAPDGFIAAGVTNNDPAFVMKLNTLVTPVWSYWYASSLSYNKIYDIIPTSDGGYAFCTLSYQSPNRYIWIGKLSSVGSLQWGSLQTGYYFGVGTSIVETPDQGFITAGYYDNGPGYQYLAIKVDSAGANVWASEFGVSNGDEYCEFIAPAPGGGYYLMGDGDSPYTIDGDRWLIKIDESGNEVWNQLFRTALNQDLESCIMVNGGQDIVSFGEENINWSNDGDCNAARYSQVDDLEAEIHALAPPVTIPAGGGSFGYSVTATNNTNSGMQVDAWIQVQHVQTEMSVEVRLFENVGLAANNSASANLNQVIPANAPPGDYIISLFLGNHPWDNHAFSSFAFTKAGVVADVVDLSVFDHPEQWINRGGFIGAENVITSNETLPAEFSLGAAYPNPFNPATTVRVALPEASDLTVQVFNVTGQQVAELANGRMTAGEHAFTFDGSNLASGLYFVRANVPGKLNAVQKLVLTK